MEKITHQIINVKPALALLTIWKEQNVNVKSKELIVFMLMAARRVIARNWKTEKLLTLEFWYMEL